MLPLEQLKKSPLLHVSIALIVVLITISLVQFSRASFSHEPLIFDLEAIKKRGKLIVLTQYSTQSFFIYRGEPKGYEYELLEQFAQEIGVSLEIRTTADYDSLFILLRQGKGDLIASHIIESTERAEEFLFSTPHTTTRQMLIQRKPKNYENLSPTELHKSLIRIPAKLVGKKVHLLSRDSEQERVEILSQLAGGEINIKHARSDVDVEDILTLVSEGTYSYTVMPETVFKGLSPFYDNLDGATALSPPLPVVWVFNQKSILLRDAASEWITTFKETEPTLYTTIYNRYFGLARSAKRFNTYMVTTLPKGTISPFDALFKEYATSRFPWTLLAAIAYQESEFDPEATSNMGAQGLMQIMPRTMAEMKKGKATKSVTTTSMREPKDTVPTEDLPENDVALEEAFEEEGEEVASNDMAREEKRDVDGDTSAEASTELVIQEKSPLAKTKTTPRKLTAQEIRQNVRYAAKYLRHIEREYWNHMPDSVGLQFTLASYNAGIGHIRDAQYLAHRLGYDSTLWTNNVERAVLKLQRQKYYNLPGVKNGYLRGIETYVYVREIMERYSQYEQHLTAVEHSKK